MTRERTETYLTIHEVAERLGVHVATVRRWCRAGRLPCVRWTKRTIRVPADALSRDGSTALPGTH